MSLTLKYFFFLNFADETLHPKFHAYVEPAKAIFPLSDDLGPRNALAPEDEDDTSGTEANIGYDPLWVPNGLLGSPMFASRQNSHIILDLSNLFPETITAFSILMWVRPTKSDYGTVLVSIFLSQILISAHPNPTNWGFKQFCRRLHI